MNHDFIWPKMFYRSSIWFYHSHVDIAGCVQHLNVMKRSSSNASLQGACVNDVTVWSVMDAYVFTLSVSTNCWKSNSRFFLFLLYRTANALCRRVLRSYLMAAFRYLRLFAEYLTCSGSGRSLNSLIWWRTSFPLWEMQTRWSQFCYFVCISSF